MLNMLLPIILVVGSHSLLGTYLTLHYSNYDVSQEITSLLFGFTMIGIVLSVASMFMQVAKMQIRKTPKTIGGFVLSIIALAVFIGCFIFRFVVRIHGMGLTIF